ncbi:MAG: serine/threonine protein kinase [Candidatus Solibacter usitatus]|nr:serine/threonine protein kinase [Candidatus Solibacter usitatus]
MKAGDWGEIERLYLEASALPPSDRAAFLLQACAGDAPLQREVESLLDADLAHGAFLDLAPSRLAADLLERSPAGFSRIGPYRILKVLGEGGMGTVYLAEQQTPQRMVALKVIKLGMGSQQALHRFDRESEALARLQHPCIAQIYEVGVADSGSGSQPYFAMEFIQGVALGEFALQLGVAAKLKVMAKVLDGVNHAHMRGIIHRDLKPGNILVDAAGQPKILDFGVAKVIDSDRNATLHTDLGQLIGTLAYMSPEQALGNPADLDTRSDVYAIGVILYELLAGKLPYQTKRDTLHESVEAIRAEEGTPLGALDRAYRGDIETMVQKALEKDKERRYSSAGEFAADIRRHLTDQPISARPPTTMYQVRKFSRRHKALVMGAAAVTVALLGGVVASTIQAVRAIQAERVAITQRDRAVDAEAVAQRERNTALAEKRRADAETESAKAVNSFLIDDLLAQADVARQAQGAALDPDLKVRTALDRAAIGITGKFAGQPLVEASIRDTIGETYRNLGLYAEAKTHLARALELHRRTAGEEDVKTLQTMGRLAKVIQDQGKWAEAQTLFTHTLDMQRRVLGPEHPETLANIGNLATTFFTQGKFAQAEALAKQAVAAQRRVLGPRHAATLSTMNVLANSYYLQSKYVLAEAMFAETLELKRRVLGPEHPSTQIGMNNLASSYARLGKYAQAEALYIEVLEMKTRLLGAEHPRTLDSMDNLAGTYARQGKNVEAEALFIKALGLHSKVMGPEHPRTLLNMGGVASSYSAIGKYAEAEKLFGETLQLQRRIVGAEHPQTLGYMAGLANTYYRQGKFAQAESLYNRTLEIQRRMLGAEHESTMETATELALLHLEQGKFAQSEPLARQIVGVERSKRPDAWQRFLAESMLGASLAGQKKYAEAEPLLLLGVRGMEARKSRIEAPSLPRLTQAREWSERLPRTR